jgi:hypothetical protein
VESPSAAFSFLITPSTRRLNVSSPPSPTMSFLTSSLPVSRTFVTTHTMSLPSVTFTLRGPVVSGPTEATT